MNSTALCAPSPNQLIASSTVTGPPPTALETSETSGTSPVRMSRMGSSGSKASSMRCTISTKAGPSSLPRSM